MSLASIREKNRNTTTLVETQITQTVDESNSKTIRKFFKQVVEPINKRTYDKYIQKTH